LATSFSLGVLWDHAYRDGGWSVFVRFRAPLQMLYSGRLLQDVKPSPSSERGLNLN
jgi:hypothetical protein